MLAVHDWTSSLVEVRITRAVIRPSPGIFLACTRSASSISTLLDIRYTLYYLPK